MIATVKVQQTTSNTMISLPKKIKESLNIEKGNTLLLETKNNQLIIIKVEE